MSINKNLNINKVGKNMQLFIVFATVIGILVNMLNFYILSKVSPLIKRLDAVELAIENEKSIYMPLGISLEKWKNNDTMHIQIEKKLDIMDGKIDRLLTR